MSMRTRKFKGFTLIELLVVISIIGMLMALLLPAVQSARESGRSNTCRNNIRNLALAAAQFEAKKNAYPGFCNPDPRSPASDASNARSWTFMLLPFLERRDLYDAYMGTASVPAEGLELVRCPSDPPDGAVAAVSSYVMNTGMEDVALEDSPSVDFAANGIGHTLIPPTDFTAVQTNAGFVSSGDGLQNTILFTENAEGGLWTDVTERGQGCIFATDDGAVVQPSVPSGGTGSGLSLSYKINGELGTGNLAEEIQYARPTAYHPGGVNVAFADGHVRFISEEISYYVFIHLMTSKGSAARNPVDGELIDYNGNPVVLDEDAIQ